MFRMKNNGLWVRLFMILFTAVFLLSFTERSRAGEPVQEDSTRQYSSLQQNQDSTNNMKASMMQMHKSMMSIKMTGDPDYDFASMMLQHHKGAIALANQEIENGKDKDLISIAKQTKDTQDTEIGQIQAFIASNKPATSKIEEKSDMTGAMDSKMMNSMNDMMNKMQNIEMKGNQDYDFSLMMIMHHQQAIDMAKDYLNNAKDEKLKQTAQKIIKENLDQIQKLQEWQDKVK